MEENEMIATGIDIHGKKVRFDYSDGWLECYCRQLVSIVIPKGVRRVCCWDNQLTELIIPEGVYFVNCSNNQITHIDLSDSVTKLVADKEVPGLEKYMGTVSIELE